MHDANDFWLQRPSGLYDPRFEHDSCGVGFVADIRGRASHQNVLDGDQVLRRLAHRGACGSEPNTGDGAGMLTALPHAFFRRIARAELEIDLPEPGAYGVGTFFLPTNEQERAHCKRTFERIVAEFGQRFLGWRDVPHEPMAADIGPSARACMPAMAQAMVAAQDVHGREFERRLFVIRKHAGNALRNDARLRQAKMFYVCSLSSKTIVYKGMLMPSQLLAFYPDLRDWDYRTHFALVHSRFSTNTFPSWDRAQPLRCMAHNGEINTLRGNLNAMRDRERSCQSAALGPHLQRLFPIAGDDLSDSGAFDNVLEFLSMAGRSLPHAVMTMIPEAWEKDVHMPADKRAFYEYHSCLMEPWDGPAAIAFSDGDRIGAVLDRNGLRPARYYVTHDQKVILASEVGVLPIDPAKVALKGRLRPGHMFLIDFQQGRLIPDDEVKATVSRAQPYAAWLREQRIELNELEVPREIPGLDSDTLLSRLKIFGYTTETLAFMLKPLAEQRRDPLGSMGDDAALACLSDQPRLLYDYFKQLFAQVTNPPIDSIREEVIMALDAYIGPEGNLLAATPAHAHRLRLPSPILGNRELATLKHIDHRGWKARTVDITWPRRKGAAGLDASLRRISREAEQGVDEGFSLLVLSDRAAGATRVPISALLACGAVHQHLTRQGKRSRVGLVLETGEAREVHHHCLLLGYGADAINPYLALEALWNAQRQGELLGSPLEQGGDEPTSHADDAVVRAYCAGVNKGLLKVMGKMGISTLRSYKGAQIFEALGLASAVIELCFTGTPSRVQGVGFDVLAEEHVRRHERAYPPHPTDESNTLPNDGQFHWRSGGEHHAWTPPSIAHLQRATRNNDAQAYADYTRAVNDRDRHRITLRSLLTFRPTTGVPLEEVEDAGTIVRRFSTGAMSLGSLSNEAHSALAISMNRLGGRSNTGEGGEDPERYARLPDGSPNPLRSAIKQVASGRFGVSIQYLASADEIQIKMAQGAKPGEGGELPGRKVDETIARIRHATPGVGLISPPPHHDIYSIEDLAQLIYDLKNANPTASVSVKLVSEVGVGTIAAGVAKAHADRILISGHDGGTGASPLTSLKHTGLPWELGLAEAQQTLVANDLRSRVTLQTDGGLRSGRDIVMAALLGAEEFCLSTAPLIALGCIMMRKCHLNTCPVGIATQDPVLRDRFMGQPEHVINLLFFLAEDARQIMAGLGFRTFDEMIGRVEVLAMDDEIVHWKAQGLDLRALLQPAQPLRPGLPVRRTAEQRHGLEQALDNRLIELARPALERDETVEAEMLVNNTDRTVGTMLSHAIVKARGDDLLQRDTIRFKFLGTAGQSFGAWLTHGVTLELEGDANDYTGKGLSGGRIVVYPSRRSTFLAENQIVVGNVVLYGAIAGQAFFRGQAAERFAVRNSGADAVVEGVGDHGCEYMTGGRVVVLGATGRNFAAGMSGGIAYVWDRHGSLRNNCNLELVELEPLEQPTEIDNLCHLIELHFKYTGSAVAKHVLNHWDQARERFVRVIPRDYKRALGELVEERTHHVGRGRRGEHKVPGAA